MIGLSDGRKEPISTIKPILHETGGNFLSGFELHLMTDNYGRHKVAKVRGWLARHPRYHVQCQLA